VRLVLFDQVGLEGQGLGFAIGDDELDAATTCRTIRAMARGMWPWPLPLWK
jgi:2-hydroxychromene-2-carboxylate isomerase